MQKAPLLRLDGGYDGGDDDDDDNDDEVITLPQPM